MTVKQVRDFAAKVRKIPRPPNASKRFIKKFDKAVEAIEKEMGFSYKDFTENSNVNDPSQCEWEWNESNH